MKTKLYVTPALILTLLVTSVVVYGIYFVGEQSGIKQGIEQGYKIGVQAVNQDLMDKCMSTPNGQLAVRCELPKKNEEVI